MAKPGENTEESWVLPSTTDCRKRRLTFWLYRHWRVDTQVSDGQDRDFEDLPRNGICGRVDWQERD